MENAKNIKFDKILAISLSLFYIITIAGHLKLLDTNFATLNFLFSIIPWVYLLIKYKPTFQKQYLFYFVIIVLIRCISLLYNSYGDSTYNQLTNIYYFLSFLISYVGVFFYYLPNIKDNHIYLKKTCYVCIFFTIVFCLYNIFSNADIIKLIGSVTDSYNLKLSSFFANRNNFGKFLFFSNVLILFAKKYEYINTRTLIVTLIITNINLLLSFSRTAIICSLILFVFYIPYKNLKKKKNLLGVALLFIVSVTLLFLLFNNLSFIDKYFIRSNIGFAGRSEIWDASMSIIKQNPLLGVGEVQSSNKLYLITSNYYYHNSFLKDFSTYGIVDGTMIIFLLIFLFKDLITKIKLVNIKKYIIGLLLSTLVYSFFEEFIFFGTGFINFMYSFIIFCLIPALINSNRKDVYEK